VKTSVKSVSPVPFAFTLIELLVVIAITTSNSVSANAAHRLERGRVVTGSIAW
jgi:hypothetical protein